MNKDLAGVSAVWRTLFGVRDGRFCCLICVLCHPYFQRAAEDGFAADMGPSLETDAVFDAALSGNYCAIAIWCLCWANKKNVMKKGRHSRA